MPNTNYLIQGTTLSGIADAIRSKSGGSDPIAVEDFASDIGDIQSGHTTTIDGVEVDRDIDLSSIIYKISGDIDFSEGAGYTLVEDAAGMGCIYKGMYMFPLLFKAITPQETVYKIVVVCPNVSGYIYKSFDLTGDLLEEVQTGSYGYNIALADFNGSLLAFFFSGSTSSISDQPYILDITGNTAVLQDIDLLGDMKHMAGVISLYGEVYGIVNSTTFKIKKLEEEGGTFGLSNASLMSIGGMTKQDWVKTGDNTKSYCARPIVSSYGSSGNKMRFLAVLSNDYVICGEFSKDAVTGEITNISSFVASDAAYVLANYLYGSGGANANAIAIPMIQRISVPLTGGNPEGTCSFIHFKGAPQTSGSTNKHGGGAVGWDSVDTSGSSDCWSSSALENEVSLQFSDESYVSSGGNILAYCDDAILISQVNYDGYPKVIGIKPHNSSQWMTLETADKTGTAYVEG